MSSFTRRYELLATLGRGAFGEVYLAEQVSSGGFRRRVAVKMLHAEHDAFEFAQQRMRDEARILGRLSHRNIVSAIDLLQMKERWALVMDYVPGADLETVLNVLQERGETMPGRAVADVGVAVCSALHAAYNSDSGDGQKLKLVHRDIKPANVRVSPDGEVKVLDFGVASAQLETRESRTGVRMGTEVYMAPERFITHDDGPEGDVYAIGVTLVELLTGWQPERTPILPDRHEGWVAEVEAKLVASGLDAELVELLTRTVQHDRSARPSALELQAALEGVAGRLPQPGIEVYARQTLAAIDGLFSDGEPTEGVFELQLDTTEETWVEDQLVAIPSTASPRPTPIPRATPLSSRAMAAVAAAMMMSLVVSAGAGAMVVSSLIEAPQTAEATSEPAVERTILAATAPTWAPLVVEAPAVGPEPLADVEVEVELPARPTAVKRSVRQSAARMPVAAPEGTAEAGAEVERVSRSLFVVPDVSSVVVQCGDTDGFGTNSVRLSKFPVGSCQVVAMLAGTEYTTTVDVQRPRTIECAVDGGALTCPE